MTCRPHHVRPLDTEQSKYRRRLTAFCTRDGRVTAGYTLAAVVETTTSYQYYSTARHLHSLHAEARR